MLFGLGVDGFFISVGALRTPGFSVRVARAEARLEEEFELFMQLLITYCELLRAVLRRDYCPDCGSPICYEEDSQGS